MEVQQVGTLCYCNVDDTLKQAQPTKSNNNMCSLQLSINIADLIQQIYEMVIITLNPQQLLPWSIFMCLLIYGYLIWVTFVIFFETYKRGITVNSHPGKVVYSLTIIVFIIEMVIQIRSSFYSKGKLEEDKYRIAKRYLGWQILTDIAGFVAVTALLINKYHQITAIFYLKIYGMIKYDEAIGSELAVSPRLYRLYKVVRAVFVYFLFANLASCIFYFLDYYQYTAQGTFYQQDELWIMYTSAMFEIVDWQIQVQYMYSIYWSLISAATIGYGDITPKNIDEVLYVTIFFAPNILFWSYLINTLFETFQESINQRLEIIKKIQTIRNMLRSRDVEVQYLNVVSYYVTETIHHSDQNAEGKEIVEQLSHDLKVELQKQIYHDVFKPFFMIHPDLPLLLADIVKETAYFSREHIEAGTDYLYVLSGKLNVQVTGLDLADFEEGSITVTQFSKGSIINFYSFITNNPHPLFRLTTVQNTILYKASHKDLTQHSQYHKYCHLLTKFAVGFYLDLHDVMCMICKKDHLSDNCPIFVLNRQNMAHKAIRTESRLTRINRIENLREQYARSNRRESIRVQIKKMPLIHFEECYKGYV